jgi:uncharacterized protein
MKSLSRLMVYAFFLVLAFSAGAVPSETIMLAMRDGTHLATDIYLAPERGSHPVILSRTPYNKAGLAGIGVEGAKRGYVVVAQDTRGRFGSEGENLPFSRDVADGFDTIEWVAKQPWCNGRIGTWGGSAVAITQFQMMASGTDKISAQHLTVGAPNLYEVAYVGGVFRKSLVEDWLRTALWSSNALPLWVSHPVYDDYWRARDASRHYKNANAPALHIGGYWDIFAQHTIDAFVGYQKYGGPKARGKQRLVMGPWAHAVLQQKVGQMQFSAGKNPPGDAHDAWKWFASTLKDQAQNPSTPPVTYYVIGDAFDTNAPGNVWRTADTWPPVKTTPTKYFINENRSLTRKVPTAGSVEYTYDPADPAPTIGGIQLTIPAGPMDQRDVEKRADVLVFTSAVLEEPLEITGQVRLKVWVSADVPDTDLIARLCDVYPDGRSFNLCEGALRARFRTGFSKERLLSPEKTYPFEIDLWSTSVIFNKGHRIRVQITSSSSPGYDPNPNTGKPFRSSSGSQKATVTLRTGGFYPSHIVLPVTDLRAR